MPNKPIELPPGVAHAFVKDMRAFFAAPSTHKQDEIAARQLQALNEHRQPRDKAPVRYWQDKRLRHTRAKWTMGFVLIAYAAVATLGLIYVYEQAATHLPARPAFATKATRCTEASGSSAARVSLLVRTACWLW